MKKSIFEAGRFVEIYHNSNTKFDVGRILFFDDTWLLSEMYDPYGKFDGFMLSRIENLLKIKYDTQYIANLCIKVVDDNGYNHEDENLFKDFVNNAVAAGSVLSFDTVNDDNYVGTILKCDDDHIFIKEYDNNGREDGITIVDASSVETLQFLNRESVEISNNILLYEKNKA